MINLETIKAGLEAGEFFLEYLPAVSLTDGHCIGAEALVRWRRPGGVVQPLDFIRLQKGAFESSGRLGVRPMPRTTQRSSLHVLLRVFMG